VNLPALALLLGAASAAEPQLDLHLWGALGTLPASDGDGAGLGGSVAWPLHPRLHLGVQLEGGLSTTAEPWLAGRPELRLYLVERGPSGGALSATLGGGARFHGALQPDLALGSALDLPGSGRILPRVQARYLVDLGGDRHALIAGVGLAWPRPRPEMPAEAPIDEPPSDGPPGSATTEPTAPTDRERWLWIPHPLRQCMIEGQVRAASEGGLQGSAIPAGLDLEALLRPTQGSLVVAARPGDRIRVGGAELPSRADGSVVSSVAAGPVDIEVVGAGRQRRFETAVAAGHALWVRGDSDDRPHHLSFDLGSAALGPAQRQALATLAANAGSWSFQLRGLYSPEGTPEANRALARARAEAVRAELLRLGLSEARLILLPPPEQADPSASPEAQRACEILPLPPGGSR